jgi:hypothetical protein
MEPRKTTFHLFNSRLSFAVRRQHGYSADVIPAKQLREVVLLEEAGRISGLGAGQVWGNLAA